MSDPIRAPTSLSLSHPQLCCSLSPLSLSTARLHHSPSPSLSHLRRHSTSMASPPSNPRCRRTGTPNWRCPEMALPGKAICEKHRSQSMRNYLKKLLSNEKDDECEILSPKNNQSKGKGKSPNGDESKGKKRKSPNGDESKGKKKKSLNDNSSKGNKKSRAVEGERDKVRKKTGRKIEDGSGKKGRVENIGMHSEGSLVLDPLLMSPQAKKGLLVGNSALLELLKGGTGDTAKSAAPNAKTEGTSRESPTMQDQNLTLSPQFMARRSRIFDSLPQNPHYLPLASYNREVRKGIIVGLDIAFVALSEKILNLNPENFRYEIGDVMKQLSDLEQMGYNVQKLKERLDTLRGILERYFASEEMVMNFETEARAHELKVGSAEDRISAFASRISELEKEIEKVKSEINSARNYLSNGRSEIENFVAQAAIVKKYSCNLKSEFIATAQSPW